MITLIGGHVQNQGGVAVPNGSIAFELNMDATLVASPGGLIPAQQRTVFQFDDTGNLIQPATIWSNAELNPQNSSGLGTYYLVTLYDANGARINKSPMWWQFPNPAGSTVDISFMTAIATIGGNVIFYPNLSGSAFNGVNAQVASYTAVPEDSGKLITFASASPVTLHLPADYPNKTWFVLVQNIGPGALTIDRNAATNTIDGAQTNLTPVPAGQGTFIGSSGSGYFTERGITQSGGGSNVPTPQSYLGWHNVVDYGAVGDSIHDDSDAIQAAIDAATAFHYGQGRVYFPPPPGGINYFVAKTIRVNCNSDSGAAQLYIYGDQGSRGGGASQFHQSPRIRVEGPANPILMMNGSRVTALSKDGSGAPLINIASCYNDGSGNTIYQTAPGSGGAGNAFAGLDLIVSGFDNDYNNVPIHIISSTDTTFTVATTTQQTETVDIAKAVIDDNSVSLGIVQVIVTGGTTTYQTTNSGGAGNAYAGRQFTLSGFTPTDTSNPARGLGQLIQFYNVAVSGGNAVYSSGGGVPGGAGNAYAGLTFTILGFGQAGNNGTFVCTASTGSTLTFALTSQVNEEHTGTAYDHRNNLVVTVVSSTAHTLTVATTTQYNVLTGFNTRGGSGNLKIEGIDFFGTAGSAVVQKAMAYMVYKNCGFSANVDPTIQQSNSAPLLCNNGVLWLECDDCDWTVANNNFIGFKNPITLSAAANASAGATVYTGTVTQGNWGPATQSVLTGIAYQVSGFTNPANNTPTGLVLTSVDAASSNVATYHGTITGGGANAFAGLLFQVTGMTKPQNNGFFMCLTSTGTTLVLANPDAAAETHAGSVTGAFICTASTLTTLTLANPAGVAETHAGTAVVSPLRQYDPSSWAPPAVLINSNGDEAGVVILKFDFCTFAFGGVKVVAYDPQVRGVTYGDAVFNSCTLEGTFGAPMFMFENRTTHGAGSGFTRVSFIECQTSDVGHPTPFSTFKGYLNNPATMSGLKFIHCLGQSGAFLQAIGIPGWHNSALIEFDADGIANFTADENSCVLDNSAFAKKSNMGWDYVGPLSVIGGASDFNPGDRGAFRTFKATGGSNMPLLDNFFATSMRDADGTDYFGGGFGEFDVHVGRLSSVGWGIDILVPTPTGVSMASHNSGMGTLIPGTTYYMRFVAGDFTANDMTAATPEISLTLAGGNDSIQVTYDVIKINTSNKYVAFIATTPGGPYHVNNFISGSGTAILNSLGGGISATVPTVGSLLATQFSVDLSQPGSVTNGNAGGVVFTSDDRDTPGTGITNAVKYLKIISNGNTYFIPLAQ